MIDAFKKRRNLGTETDRHTRKMHVKMIAEIFGIYKQEMPKMVSKPPGARQQACNSCSVTALRRCQA